MSVFYKQCTQDRYIIVQAKDKMHDYIININFILGLHVHCQLTFFHGMSVLSCRNDATPIGRNFSGYISMDNLGCPYIGIIAVSLVTRLLTYFVL